MKGICRYVPGITHLIIKDGSRYTNILPVEVVAVEVVVVVLAAVFLVVVAGVRGVVGVPVVVGLPGVVEGAVVDSVVS